MNLLNLIIIFWTLGKKYAKSYADSLVGGSTCGLRWKGAVNYYNNLPDNPIEGDCYTVMYKGTSGYKADGTEYAWGRKWRHRAVGSYWARYERG